METVTRTHLISTSFKLSHLSQEIEKEVAFEVANMQTDKRADCRRDVGIILVFVYPVAECIYMR